MKTIYFILLTICSCHGYSQNQNPHFLDSFPMTTKYEHLGHKDLHVGEKGSDLFLANLNENTSLLFVKTENFPDCLLTVNKFNGNDIYKKLKSGEFQRIIHVKKVFSEYKVFYVDDNNYNYKLVLTADEKDGHTVVTSTLLGYTFYWNNLSK